MNETNTAKTVIALGNFDGVHIGHASLIKICVEKAEALGCRPMIWTFERHRFSPPYIIDKSDKLGLFQKFGIDSVEFADFNAIRSLTPRQFVSEVLIGRHNCICAVCGFNFRFGRDRSGGCDTLRELCAEYGIECTVCDEVSYMGQPVSSTRIRKALEDGDTEAVRAMLGRPYTISLPIVAGRQVGRRLEMPTMNQRFPDGMVIPKNGVYAGRVTIDRKVYACVTNIGVRPTFDDGNGIVCESHILGLSGDLYGKNIPLELVSYLRGEIKFEKPEQLVEQIKRDIIAAKEIIGI